MDIELPKTVFVRCLATFVVLFSLGLWAVFLYSHKYIETRKQTALQLIGAVSNTVTQRLNASISLTYTLEALLRERHFEINQESLERIAGPLLRQQPAISSLQYAPDGIVSYIAPLEGNEEAIGHDLLADPERNKEAFDSVQKHLLTVAGPFELLQGGVALVARLPIFFSEGKQEKFWGFSTVLILIQDLMRDASIENLLSQGYEWNIYRVHPDTLLPHVFYGTSDEVIEDSVRLEVNAPNAIWYFNIKPSDGWMSGQYVHIVLMLLIVIVFSSGFSSFVYFFQKQPFILKKQVESRTAELQKAKDELDKHQNKLEALVAERTYELEKAQDELLQYERLTTLGKLTATVSHELRNPLGTIRSSLFNIENAVKNNDTEKLHQSLALTERSIERCVKIIEELNSYARVKKLNVSETCVDDWLKEVVVEQNIPKDIVYELNLSCGVSAAFDPEKFRQVVVNIISNAVHALQEKQSDDKRLWISTRRLGNRYEILFRDNGIGISDDIKEKIFTPLFSTKGFGVGLGMVIVKNIVEQHHGKVSVRCDDAEGTSIIIHMPISFQQ